MRHIRAANTRDQRSTPTAADATDWRDRAACLGEDTSQWFNDTETGIERAKRACAECPALIPCREYAITKPERYGVFGGMSADERKAERRNRGRRTKGAA